MAKFLWENFLLSQAGVKTEILLCGKFQDPNLITEVRNQNFLQNDISNIFLEYL